MPIHPVIPDAVRLSAFTAWQELPGGFTKHDRLRGSLSLAALAEREDVTVVRLHLDLHDRPTVVAVVAGPSSAALFIEARTEGVQVLVKGESVDALAAGLEVAGSCVLAPRGT